MRWDGGDTSAALRGGVQMSTKLSSLTQRARENPKHRFTRLIDLMTEDFLVECFGRLKRDKAPGVDGVTYKEYGANLEQNVKDLVVRMKAWRYRPNPSRRVYISKSEGKKRPLGIPGMEDKVVEMGIKRILEAIWEVDFEDVSFGFCPQRSCHQALNVLDKVIMTKPVNFVVDMDIKKFFDTVDHKWLNRCLEQRIKDPHVLRLIGRFLNTGVIEEGKYVPIEKGTPQGAVLSPVMANIYLHYILDLWFEKVVKSRLKGFAQLIRFADDFVVCFQSQKEAKEFREALEQRLGKFGLEIAEDKSKIIEFGRYAWQKAQTRGEKVATFDFLGFTHYCDRTRKGKFKLGRKTARKKFVQKTKALNQWMKHVRNFVELKQWWQALRLKLFGHYRYYGISGNMLSLRAYYTQTLRLAHKWINRRSQKKSYNWRQFLKFVKYNPLPLPKIYHSIYTLSS